MLSTGQKIKKLRKNKKLSQSQLAEALDTTTATISRWERDDGSIPLNRLSDVARYFDIPASDLLPDQEPTQQLKNLNAYDIDHLAGLAGEDVASIADYYAENISNRLSTLASDETFDTKRMDFREKTEDEKLTKDQAHALKVCMSDLSDMSVRLQAAIHYWFSTVSQAIQTDSKVTTDRYLKAESLSAQNSELLKARKKDED